MNKNIFSDKSKQNNRYDTYFNQNRFLRNSQTLVYIKKCSQLVIILLGFLLSNNNCCAQAPCNTSSSYSVTACGSYTWPINSATYTVSGTYTYTTLIIPGCINTDILNLTINPIPSGTFSIPTIPCYGDSVLATQLTGSTNCVVAYRVCWPPVPPSASNRLPLYVKASSLFPQHVIMFKDTCTGCYWLDSVVVTQPTKITTTLFFSGCGSYTWALSGNTYTVSTIDSVKLTAANGCDSTVFGNITINPIPSVNSSASSSSITNGNSTILSASGASTYLWFPGSISGNSITVSPSVTTTYTVIGTDANGCTNSSIITITVIPFNSSGSSVLISINHLIQTAPNIFEFAVECVNTGSTTFALRGYSFGLNHSNGLSNGGILTYTFVSRDPVFANLPSVSTNYSASSNHLRATTLSATPGNEVVMTPNTSYILATMRVQTSAASFPNNFNPWLPNAPLNPIQLTTAPGKTQCILNVLLNYSPGFIAALFGSANTPFSNAYNILSGDMNPTPTGSNPFILNPPTSTLNVTCFIEGYWDGSSAMLPVLFNQGQSNPVTDCDTIGVELHDALAPFSTAYSTTAQLHTDGTATAIFNSSITGNYYVVIKHRTALQTWSASPISMGPIASYNFSTAATQAYGSNQAIVSPGVYAFYSGDIMIDENMDLLDLGLIESDISSFMFGYLSTDINGDGNVDLLDTPLVENNLSNFVFSIHP